MTADTQRVQLGETRFLLTSITNLGLASSWLVGWLVLLGLVAVTVLLVSAAVAGPAAARLGAGFAVAIAMPLTLRLLARRRARRLRRTTPRLGRWFVGGWNLTFIVVFLLGFPGWAATTVERHGAWVVDGVEGWVPRQLRRVNRELAALLDGRPRAGLASVTAARPASAPAPAAAPPVAPADAAPARPAPAIGGWIHPLANAKGTIPAEVRPLRRVAADGGRDCPSRRCPVVFACAPGQPVRAVRRGVVIAIKRARHPGGGKTVELSHGDGEASTIYGDLASVSRGLRPGGRVDAGQVLGHAGRAKDRGVLFGVRAENGKLIDPIPILLVAKAHQIGSH